MSNYAVIKGASYVLAAAPDMVLHNGKNSKSGVGIFETFTAAFEIL